MLRNALLVAVAFSSACMIMPEDRASYSRRPTQREEAAAPAVTKPIALDQESSPRTPVPLDACREFPDYETFKASLVTTMARDPRPGPEWQQHGMFLGETHQKRLLLAWADGYQESDSDAKSPIPRPWVSCLLPASLHSDIPSISYGVSMNWKVGVVDLNLLDEGVDPKDGRPRREFRVAVDVRSRQTLPRALCYLSTSVEADPPQGTVCLAKRECAISQTTGALTAGAWSGATKPGCYGPLTRLSSPSDRAEGKWSFPAPPAWY